MLKMWISAFLRNFYMRLCCLLRPHNVTFAYFRSFNGQYSDNPRAISEKLHEVAPNISQIWVLNDISEAHVPEYVNVVSAHSLKSLKAMAQSKLWVMNTCYSKCKGFYKPRDTFYVQTWHGDRGFKRIGYLAAEVMGKEYRGIHTLPYMKDCNLCLAGSDFGVKNMRGAFKYDGPFLEKGCPRNDKLVNIDKNSRQILDIKRSLDIDPHKKILLFAPTFRDKAVGKQKCNVNIRRMIGSLPKTERGWICLVRSHSSSEGILLEDNNKDIIDVSKYPDMADLLLITDILVTDYSSCATDFVLTGNPVIMVLFDLEDYIHSNRSLFVTPTEVGFLCAYNQDDLDSILSQIENFDHRKIAEKINAYYGTHESGDATTSAVDVILRSLQRH